MSIKNRSAMIIFELIISLLSAFAAWLQFSAFGLSAWRLFSTWIALVAAIYFALNALITLIAKRRAVGTEFFPMLQGGLIVSSITLILIHIISYASDAYVPSAGGSALLTGFLLPVLIIMSWVIFSQKGVWRAYDPFYWLSLSAIYVSAILVSGEFMPRTARLVYPYDFLNYPAIGIDTMLWWLAVFAAIILPVGFIFWLLDFALSGKLAKHVVLPKIKVMIVEEEVEDDPKPAAKKPEVIMPKSPEKPKTAKPEMKSEPKPKETPKNPEETKPAEKSPEKLAEKSDAKKAESKPAEKPVKLVTTGARNQIVENNDVKPDEKNPALKTSVSEITPPSLPPVRIIEKISVENRAAPPKPADNRSQEIVIDGDQKSLAPKVEPPKVETKVDAPKVEPAKPEIPKVEPQKAEAPKAEAMKPAAPKVDLPEPPVPPAPSHLPMPPKS